MQYSGVGLPHREDRFPDDPRYHTIPSTSVNELANIYGTSTLARCKFPESLSLSLPPFASCRLSHFPSSGAGPVPRLPFVSATAPLSRALQERANETSRRFKHVEIFVLWGMTIGPFGEGHAGWFKASGVQDHCRSVPKP